MQQLSLIGFTVRGILLILTESILLGVYYSHRFRFTLDQTQFAPFLNSEFTYYAAILVATLILFGIYRTGKLLVFSAMFFPVAGLLGGLLFATDGGAGFLFIFSIFLGTVLLLIGGVLLGTVYFISKKLRPGFFDFTSETTWLLILALLFNILFIAVPTIVQSIYIY